MNPAHSKEKARSIERLMGWKAKQELIRSIQEKNGAPLFPNRQGELQPI